MYSVGEGPELVRIWLPSFDPASPNEFCGLFASSLRGAGCKLYFDSIFSSDFPPCDVVHIHWPEYLSQNPRLGLKEISKSLRSVLPLVAKLAPIVYTVHNLSPHSDQCFYSDLYAYCFEYASGFIHLGSGSIGLLQKVYGSKYQSVPKSIIPHGPYSPYYAESLHGIHRPVDFVTLGSIRNARDLALLRELFRFSRMHGFKAVSFSVDCVTLPSLKNPFAWPRRFYFSFLRFLMLKASFLRVCAIDMSSVNDACLSAKILFVPRSSSLNSGLVYQGLSCGNIVVGPDIGNIGEAIDRHGGFGYDPKCRSSVHLSLMKAIEFYSADSCSNVSWVNRLEGWGAIAQKHLLFYKSLLSR